MSEPPRELSKALFIIAIIAFTLMLILAVGIWGCDRWNRNKSHNMPNTRLLLPVHSSPLTVHS